MRGRRAVLVMEKKEREDNEQRGIRREKFIEAATETDTKID